jgi:CHAT domain-containing protein/predicted negative regulator of RcsB-dependent stress response
MARTRTTFFDRVQTLLSQSKQAILLFLVALTVALTSSAAYSQDLLQQGYSLYKNGQYYEAATVLQQVVKQSSDPLQQALALSNLSLVYQALNQWDQAQGSIDESLNRLRLTPTATTHQKAQALEVRGQLALSTGKAQIALEDWRSAAQLFEQGGDRVAASRTRLHQTLALQHLGLYREAFATLQKPRLEFNQQSDLQVSCLRSLSNTIRVVGTTLLSESGQDKQLELSSLGKICSVSNLPNLENNTSSSYLEIAEQLLRKAQTFNLDQALKTEIWLDLGNLKRDAYYRAKDAYERAKTPTNKQDVPKLITETLEFYQQAIDQPASWIHLQAKLNQLMFLVEVDRWLSATPEPEFLLIAQEVNARLKIQRPSLSALVNQLEKLPASHTTFQMRLHLVHSLLPNSTEEEKDLIAALLTQTQAQAETLGDRASQSYALGYRGWLEELQSPQSKNWLLAYQSTNAALKLTEDLRSPQIAYEWQWQQGRILREMGNRQAAIAAYDTALESLDKVRRDLLGLGNPDLQFSFRDRVEPVYRELVELLLVNDGAQPENQDLEKARVTIANLQVAQLENFLRCTLQVKDPVQLDAIADQHKAAIIYPILLSDRLATIVKSPQSKVLQYYAFKFQKDESSKELNPRCLKLNQFYLSCDTRSQVVDKLRKFRQQLEVSKGVHRRLAEEIYDWLIRPVEADSSLFISSTKVKTFVFVLDNDLQQIPMAALYDRQDKKYLVEKYAIVLNLGLQLEKSRSRLEKPFNGISGGLTGTAAKLKYAEAELDNIRPDMVEVLKNEQFTQRNFQNKLNSAAFRLVHLVTHGEFTSDPETTGVDAFDGLINLNKIRDIFQVQSQNRSEPIELLVLSACRTAAGDSRAPLGMAGVAVRSGARSTLASLWYTDDQFTSVFMKEFYQNLKAVEALNKAEALQRTQKTLIELNIAPVNWAQFVLLGNWL